MGCISLLGLTSFALTQDDLGDRLNLLITLILTAVAFGVIVTSSLPNVPYLTYLDKYILSQYMFLVFIMGETAFLDRGTEAGGITEETDTVIFWLCLAWTVLFNIGFFVYGYWLRQKEALKLTLSSDDIEREVNHSRPALKFDYAKRQRAGDGKRLLSFIGIPQTSEGMSDKDRERMQRNATRIEAMYEENTTKKK